MRPPRQHPLFSPVAIGSTVLLFLLLGGALWFTGGRAFNPGPLSAVAANPAESGGAPNHAAIGDNCGECHAPFQGTTAARCEACHTTIAAGRAEGIGLHGRISSDDCAACHDEHNGADYDLFAAALEQFDAAHHAALFPLDGAHAELECAACHADEQYTTAARTCAGCHEEPAIHQSLFGTDCAACHTTDGWRPARLARHLFPLDHGEAGEIACAVCHRETFTAYTCAECHGDAEMIREHEEEGVDATREELMACVTCHPTGEEEEE